MHCCSLPSLTDSVYLSEGGGRASAVRDSFFLTLAVGAVVFDGTMNYALLKGFGASGAYHGVASFIFCLYS